MWLSIRSVHLRRDNGIPLGFEVFTACKNWKVIAQEACLTLPEPGRQEPALRSEGYGSVHCRSEALFTGSRGEACGYLRFRRTFWSRTDWEGGRGPASSGC